ncbi:hypothetical protein [Veillonella sp.]|uniref:hypothetical protein n=1 Tax=Veillonella sp. TaxID=1926307 RepID=UPI0025CF1F0F|nr:hypothetical protein [Veillonella sp.]
MRVIDDLIRPILYSITGFGLVATVGTVDVGQADGVTIWAVVATSAACFFAAEWLGDRRIMTYSERGEDIARRK